MVDALASGASVRMDVGVQVPPRAQRDTHERVGQSLTGSFCFPANAYRTVCPFLLSLLLLWRLNYARGREDFRWYVVPEDEAEEAVPPEPLSAEERERLTRELDEVNRRWREALEAGFLSGGSLAAHEIRAELEERATALRRRLEAPSPPGQ